MLVFSFQIFNLLEMQLLVTWLHICIKHAKKILTQGLSYMPGIKTVGTKCVLGIFILCRDRGIHIKRNLGYQFLRVLLVSFCFTSLPPLLIVQDISLDC